MADLLSVSPRPRRVAVVGSGVAGLTAAHVLRSGGTHVTLYEAASRLGGHADTHLVDVAGRTVAVDTGFLVHNDRTYPTLLRLFAELGVETRASEMSMSMRFDGSERERGIEYAGALGLRGLFPSVDNLRSPQHLRMLWEVKRFHRQATAMLASPEDDETLDGSSRFRPGRQAERWVGRDGLVPRDGSRRHSSQASMTTVWVPDPCSSARARQDGQRPPQPSRRSNSSPHHALSHHASPTATSSFVMATSGSSCPSLPPPGRKAR